MTKTAVDRFRKLRKEVMAAIRRQLEDDAGCKSYEGTFEWLTGYPCYFADETGTAQPDFYKLTLHCYVLGPSRHYEWMGATPDEVLDQAERDIHQWIRGGEW